MKRKELIEALMDFAMSQGVDWVEQEENADSSQVTIVFTIDEENDDA